MSANSTFSAARVTPNLAHAWGGIWRLTFRRLLLPGHWLTLAIGLAVLGLIFVGGLHGEGDRFLDWVGNFYVAFLVPVVAFMAAGGVMRDEMKSGTVDYVLTRPIPRPAFIVFKYLAHTLCAQIDFLVAFVVVVIFLVNRHTPDLPATLAKLFLGQVLMVTAFSAFGFLCGVLTSRYVVIGLAYAAVIEAGVGQIPTQVSRLSMTHQVRDLLAVLLGRLPEHAATPGVASTLLILIAFSAVMLAIAAAIFTWRELSSPTDS
jgi:ABC-type transport system involved in multi-copper enzyme maturation permease subunit